MSEKRPPKDVTEAGGLLNGRIVSLSDAKEARKKKKAAEAKAKARAEAKAKAENDPDWWRLVQKTDRGRVVSSAANAATIIRHDPQWRDVLEYDERAGEVRFIQQPPFPNDLSTSDTFPRGVTDPDLTRIAAFMARKYDATFNGEAISSALDVVARENSRDVVREYLDSLTWDRRPRIDSWVTSVLGAENTPYHSAVGAKWLISAVARAYKPGCQADHVMVLEGKQGTGKSTAARLLASEEFFSDELGDVRNKDTADSLRGKWIIEIAELDAMQRSEVTAVKAFVTKRADRFRPAYGRRTMDFPRRCVFIASTNEAAYLRDPTGARRFWPVRCGNIRLDAVLAERDQLWAEAVYRYRAGDTWHPDQSLAIAAGEEQEARYQGDAWEDEIGVFLNSRSETTIREIALRALDIEIGKLGQAEQNRIARALSRLGWVADKNPSRLVIEGASARVRIYRRSEAA